MSDKKTSESQDRAIRNWQNQNKDHSNYLKSRSAARSFIKNKAKLEDLKELKGLIEEKRKKYKEF
ncbi:hypothetical protein [Listeria fleischmannii]|uniref:Uncharacterized protein n=1 Tax=Listeria fleischmannii FSL S10-1203 TaxID=1265822 RepID=W7D3K4_9LIST|nr:hypothetical protein [Listeria fleischmannii]EUJ43540.1 hypothetical protein MCOL2_20503 [Listeria fleischmannii FSL S10-1203]